MTERYPRPPPSLPPMLGETESGELLERLHVSAANRLRRAFAPRSQGPLSSALRAFGRFASACPGRELFKEPRALGDRAAAAHNEWTLILFAGYLASTTSRRTRRIVAARTIKSYVSLLKGYLEHIYAFELAERPTRLRRFLDSLQAEDPRSGRRRRRRGLRRRHLLRMWEEIAEWRTTSVRAVNELALLSTAWHILARGGEVVSMTRADLRFRKTKSGRRFAEVWLWPLKKKLNETAQKIPQFVTEHDGGGADTYWALRRLVVYDPVPEGEAASTPLFRTSERNGRRRKFTTTSMRVLLRRCMRQIGEKKTSDWGCHSARIGGATDLASTGRLCQSTLQAKGRWASDVAKIYARGTRRSQLEASALMQRARGRDLEEIYPSYSQPA